jgi:peptide/nickel transport system substrate-binding protein
MGAPIWGVGNLVRLCRVDVYKACPALAESWEVNGDFTQYTFKIRPGVLWHDGHPFTAEDAKFWADLSFFGAKSGDKVRRPGNFRADFGELKNVETLDGGRVRLTLVRPNRFLLETIGAVRHHLGYPKHLMQPRIDAGDINVTPQDIGVVGTGPFRLVKHERGVRTQVRRFDKYWEKDPQGRQLPYLDGVDFAIIPDASAQDAAFRVGRLDSGSPTGSHRLGPERRDAHIKDLGDKVWFTSIPSGGSVSAAFSFNLLRPGPWQDVRVRKAISLWIDKQQAVVALHEGFGQVSSLLAANNPFTSPDFMTWPGFNPTTKEKDRAEAKRLMAEAGYAKGFSMTRNCNTTGVWIKRCLFYQDQLKGLGIDLKLTLMNTAQWNEAALSLDYDSTQSPATAGPIPEGAEAIFTVYSVSKAPKTKHEDAKVPEFYRRLNATTSFDERVKIWREFERYMILDQVLLVPMTTDDAVVPFRSRVKGVALPAEFIINIYDYAQMWVDD